MAIRFSSLRPLWLLVGSATAAGVIAVAAIAWSGPALATSPIVTAPGPVILDPLTECQNAIGDQPRIALARCLSDALNVADKQMRQTYADMVKDLRGIDSSGTPKAVATLNDAQKAFVKFREAECLRVGAAAMGGSGAGDMQTACMIKLTRWRTADLTQS